MPPKRSRARDPTPSSSGEESSGGSDSEPVRAVRAARGARAPRAAPAPVRQSKRQAAAPRPAPAPAGPEDDSDSEGGGEGMFRRAGAAKWEALEADLEAKARATSKRGPKPKSPAKGAKKNDVK
jgi:hypothetical protein